MLKDFFLRFPEGRARALTFSYDDGVEQDLRLRTLLDRYGLKGTFNLNSGLLTAPGAAPADPLIRRMTERQVLEAFAGTPHEIGLHGLRHLYLEQLPPARATYEILEDRARLEALFHTWVRGGAYPYGTWNEQTLDSLRACGVDYFRTTQDSHSFDVPQDWLRLAPTCHHNDPQLPALAERFLHDPVERRPYLFYIWGHSYEFERDDNWALIENLAQTLSGRAEVYYATNGEVFDYVAAFRALRISCDGRRVLNPTATPVWYVHCGRAGCVQPGEQVVLED